MNKSFGDQCNNSCDKCPKQKQYNFPYPFVLFLISYFFSSVLFALFRLLDLL